MNPEHVLRTFAELSRSGPAAPTNVLRQSRDFEWLRYKTRRVFAGKNMGAYGLGDQRTPYYVASDSDRRIERLLAAGALHQSEQLLRVGWIWLAGTVTVDGKATRYCLPVLSVPVAKVRPTVASIGLEVVSALAAGSGYEAKVLEAVGDPEITPLIEDATLRDELLATIDFGDELLRESTSDLGDKRLGPSETVLESLPQVRAWCERAAHAMGVTIDEFHLAGDGRPPARRKEDGIAAFVGFGLYIDQAPTTDTHRGGLLSLALMKGLDRTAFAKLYGSQELRVPPPRTAVAVRPMSRHQAGVAGQAGSSDVAVISGAPGTGKTHLLSVIALDAVARGESVLVVGSSAYSVDVLLDHFAATGGPAPVAFGSSRHHGRLATELSDLMSNDGDGGTTDADVSRHESNKVSLKRMLAAEIEARRQETDPGYRIDRTAELDQAGEPAELAALFARVVKPRAFDFRPKRHRRKLERRLGIDDGESSNGSDGIDRLGRRLDELAVVREAQRLLAAEGLTLESGLADFAELDGQAAANRAGLVARKWIAGLDSRDRRTLATVAHAMNVGRSQRRRLLAELDSSSLTDAAPLWVGAAADVNDVLPQVAGMFDLVIIDEASQMSQPHSAAALVRAKRAIVCGDPEQLGHVSFVSDEQIREAAAMFDTDPSLVDIRSNSIYDIAATQMPVAVLDEHFRSAPHLIEFSARRFYGGSLLAATRHPSNEAADHIHVELVDGKREGPKAKRVNHAEVRRCLEVAERYIADGCQSIGFLSPFRAQAEALEEAILDTYRLEQIERYGLRVGTVHGFQGDERDVMIVSWAVGPDEPSTSWRFVNQSTLFNVMVTRAREEIVIVTSDPEPPGLAGEYLKWEEPLTDLIPDGPPSDPWVATVVAAFGEHGVACRTGYRVGRHLVDLVVGEGAAAVAIDCVPHSDGPEAHLDRALQLRRAGWRTADAFESRWKGRAGQFVIEFLSRFSDLRPQN